MNLFTFRIGGECISTEEIFADENSKLWLRNYFINFTFILFKKGVFINKEFCNIMPISSRFKHLKTRYDQNRKSYKLQY